MDVIAKHLGTDHDGITHIGNPRAGCWNCGAQELKYSENGKVALHHPGSECCEPAIKRLLGMHAAELARHRGDARSLMNEVTEAEQRAGSTYGNAGVEAKDRARRMRSGYERREREYWVPLANELKTEMARLEAKLRAIA
jgi:hypothetical protein